MFKLPELPYPHGALEPVISAETMHLHHDKHHAKYVETLNKLLADEGMHPTHLEAVIQETAGDERRVKLFDNAAQAWNHAFFWEAMSPEAEKPNGRLTPAINEAFGDLEQLKAAFVKEGAGHFGSGWVWLAADGAALKVMSTHDADDTLSTGQMTPLLVCDLWEHAYYLDYQNDREGFLKAWFDRLPNWTFAERQFLSAQGEGEAWTYPSAA
ncbi:MAG: superoxide dismutase [Caulobacteraceae bacterium]